MFLFVAFRTIATLILHTKTHKKIKKNTFKKITENAKMQFFYKCAETWLKKHQSPTKKESTYVVSSVIDNLLKLGKFAKPDEIEFAM